jgi:hypothetical protein
VEAAGALFFVAGCAVLAPRSYAKASAPSHGLVFLDLQESGNNQGRFLSVYEIQGNSKCPTE